MSAPAVGSLECERPAPKDRPQFASPNAAEHLTAWDRRRAASRRLAILPCACADPWTHRPAPGGYALAAEHLAACGLLAAPPADIAELRALWHHGDRELAEAIATVWQVTA